jgi:molecular chaperone DnaK (HSP70)
MTVVGIDFGNESVVVAVAANRGVDIVLNVACNRATPVFLTFSKRGGRLFGDVARDARVSHAPYTVCNLKRLIGRRYDDPIVQRECANATVRCEETPDGMVACIVPVHRRTDDGALVVEEESFTPVELLAAFLSFVRRDVCKSLRSDVSECVLSCPTFFKQSQRLALLDAARIAEWRVSRLLHETTAALVAYSMPRPSDNPHTVAIVDVGHAHLQVSVARVDGAECDVLSYVHDEHVGGRAFDELIAWLADADCDASASPTLASMPEAMQKGRLRILQECEKVKRVLSTNKDAHLTVECVPDVHGNLRDLSVCITRQQFEARASGMLDAIQSAAVESLRVAAVDRVDRVELVGGGSRTPCVIACVARALLQEPSRTIDSSECVAKGCAMFAAMLSPRYQSRPFVVSDISAHAISLRIDDSVELVYKANTRLDRPKKVALTITPSTRLGCVYGDSEPIGACTVAAATHGDGDARSSSSATRRVQLVVTVDADGIFRFVTIRPVKSKVNACDTADATLGLTVYYSGQASDVAMNEMQRRHEMLCQRDAHLERCDEVRNQLAALLFERPSRDDETFEALTGVVEDDATPLATLSELLRTMQQDGGDATNHPEEGSGAHEMGGGVQQTQKV